MPHLIINGEDYELNAKAISEARIVFGDFVAKCTECKTDLRKAKIEGTVIKCTCGATFPIITDSPNPEPKEKPMSDKPATKVKTEKIVKAKTAPIKVEKAKVEKPVAKKTIKPVAAKGEKKAAVARDGSISSTELVFVEGSKLREASYPAVVAKFFKKATAPVKVLDKIAEAWKADHDESETCKKNPRGYATWYILHMVRKGMLKKA